MAEWLMENSLKSIKLMDAELLLTPRALGKDDSALAVGVNTEHSFLK